MLAQEPAVSHPRLVSHVHGGDGAGVLAALAVSLSSCGSVEAVFDKKHITNKQRRALRCDTIHEGLDSMTACRQKGTSAAASPLSLNAVGNAVQQEHDSRKCPDFAMCRRLLLQQQSLTIPGGSSDPASAAALRRRHTLQRLPIFTTAASAAAAASAASGPAQAAAPSQEAAAAAANQPVPNAATPADLEPQSTTPEFMDLLGERFIAPPGVQAAALPAGFVAVGDEAEPAALALLGVQRPLPAAVYRQVDHCLASLHRWRCFGWRHMCETIAEWHVKVV